MNIEQLGIGKREILFRGKRVDNGEWVKGYYYQSNEYFGGNGRKTLNHYIVGKITGSHEPVDPKTVCQFTGLKDKNGKKIFAGDILKTENGKEAVIEFYIGYRFGYRLRWKIGNWFISNTLYTERCEVTGDIFNQKLLK